MGMARYIPLPHIDLKDQGDWLIKALRGPAWLKINENGMSYSQSEEFTSLLSCPSVTNPVQILSIEKIPGTCVMSYHKSLNRITQLLFKFAHILNLICGVFHTAVMSYDLVQLYFFVNVLLYSIYSLFSPQSSPQKPSDFSLIFIIFG